MKAVFTISETGSLFCCTPTIDADWSEYSGLYEPNVDEIDGAFFLDIVLATVARVRRSPPEELLNLDTVEIFDSINFLKRIAKRCIENYPSTPRRSGGDIEFELLGSPYFLPRNRISPPELQLWRLSLLLGKMQNLIDLSLDMFVSNWKFTSLQMSILNEVWMTNRVVPESEIQERIWPILKIDFGGEDPAIAIESLVKLKYLSLNENGYQLDRRKWAIYEGAPRPTVGK